MSRDSDEPMRGRTDSEPDADLRRVLVHLERPAARPEFRAALRERFLAGAAEPEPVVAPRTPDGGSHRGPTEAPRGGGRLVLLAGALAAAAAIVLTLFLTRSRSSTWRVHPASTATTVLVDGVALRLDDVTRLAQALDSARELEAVGGFLRIGVRDEAWIQLAAGTRLTQMRFAAAGPFELCAERGGLAVATLPEFRGRGMRVRTADFDLTVTGTSFGVDVDADGSCVCTLAGSVRCEVSGGTAAQPVEAGRSCFVPRDGREPAWGVAHESHLEPLRDLCAAIE